MGKPAPSFHKNVIGICIAKTACASTGNKLDLVARSGQYSIFRAVKEIYNPCIRDEISSRDGITEVQLNKALQKAGFKRVRDRRAHAIKRKEDPTGAGMYLFSNLRWRDPANKQDRLELIAGWNSIIERFPKIAGQCCLGRFLQVVEEFHNKWLPNAEKMTRHALEMEIEDDSVIDSHSEEERHSAAQTPTPDTMLRSPVPSSLLNQEILRLQLELATAQTLVLLQHRSPKTDISLPSLSPPPALALPQPGNNASALSLNTINSLLSSFAPTAQAGAISGSPTFAFTGQFAASNLHASQPLSALLSAASINQKPLDLHNLKQLLCP